MTHKRGYFIRALLVLSSFYLIYQIYNLAFDIYYKLFQNLEFDTISLTFLLLSIINIIINIIFIVKLYHIRKDALKWLHILFAYNILEILIAAIYLLKLDFSPFTPDYKFLLIRISFISTIIIIFWIISSVYLKKELK